MSIEDKIAAISASSLALQTLLSSQTTKAREFTASLLAEVYDAGLYALQPGREEELVKAISDRGMLAPKPDENAWGKVVRICCGDWRKDASGELIRRPDGAGIWDRNRSLDKYARVLRHADESGIAPESFASYVLGYDHEVHGRMLDGIIRADKEKHPAAQRGLGADKVAAANIAAQTKVQGSIALQSASASEERQFTCAFGFTEAGTFHLIDLIPDSEKAALSQAAKLGRA